MRLRFMKTSRARRNCGHGKLSTAFRKCCDVPDALFRERASLCYLRNICVCLILLLPARQCWTSGRLQPVTPGVYVVLQPLADRFNDANSTIIVMSDAVAVIDTQGTLTEARAEIEAIKRMTDKPVRWVINTHWHTDHIQGNQVYREAFPGVQFVAQTNSREDMTLRAIPELQEQVAKLPEIIERSRDLLATGFNRDGKALTEDQEKFLEMRIHTFSKELPDLKQTHIVPPDITFETSMSLFSGDQEIRLTHYAGHTRGDLVVFLPAKRILITGDLLDDMPYTGDGSPTGLVQTLRHLDNLDFDLVIPGHGGIEKGHEHLRLIASLFDSIVVQVQEDIANGLSLEETEREVKIDDFRQPVTGGEEHATRAFNAWIPVAIERAYKEAKGTVD